MKQQQQLLIAFYGDDFTGSTDALETLTLAGAKTMLFFEIPTPEDLELLGDLDAIGIAGYTRALDKIAMRTTLQEAFSALAALQPKFVHYKVCSTFDSSEDIGNLGVAIACGQEIFKNTITPIIVAAPYLGRYVAFGNLFARMGIGSQGEIYRIDQHPSMAHHPVTPAKEGDLRDHLALQTPLQASLINYLDLEESAETIQSKITTYQENGSQVVFFDGLYNQHLTKTGEVLEGMSQGLPTLFALGSSGVGTALGNYWDITGKLANTFQVELITACNQLLVLSGSLSPVTAGQLEYALANGFKEVVVPADILIEEHHALAIEACTSELITLLQQGYSVMVHTSKGKDDPRVDAVKNNIKKNNWTTTEARKKIPELFGKALGTLASEALTLGSIDRLVIAGGDTSSYTAAAMHIKAVSMLAPFVKGAPLCNVYAPDSPADGIEINLKGGQVGAADYFVALKNGTVNKK